MKRQLFKVVGLAMALFVVGAVFSCDTKAGVNDTPDELVGMRVIISGERYWMFLHTACKAFTEDKVLNAAELPTEKAVRVYYWECIKTVHGATQPTVTKMI